jgi:hypothetical protein
MNERIRLLAEKAGIYKLDLSDETEYWILEKFAELIVKECVGITDDLVNRNVDGSWTSNELYTDYNGALHEVKRRIQETFGVEL